MPAGAGAPRCLHSRSYSLAVQPDLVGAAAGACAIAAAFGALGLALFTDYRGLTTWHARQTMPLRELRGEPEDGRQYRLER